MKKKLLFCVLIVLSLFTVTACGGISDKKIYTCTSIEDATQDEVGIVKEIIEAELDDNDKIKSFIDTTIFKSEEIAKQYYQLFEFYNSIVTDDENKINVKINGNTIIIEDADSANKIAGKESYVGLSKEEFKIELEKNKDNTKYNCK